MPASSPIPRCLAITALANEGDYVLIDISAADGRFAGGTELYEGDQRTHELAIGLRGFPLSPDDRRVVALGSMDKRVADGHVEITCQCDLGGHAILQIQIMDKYRPRGLGERRVRVLLPVEASAIDVFVEQLSKWDHAPGSTVSLPSAT